MLGRLVKHILVYCTSAVHVAGHYRVQVASLEVKQEASFRIVPLQAHQSVKNHLHPEKHMYMDILKPFVNINGNLPFSRDPTPLGVCVSKVEHAVVHQPDCDAL